ncbi:MULTISPECIES: ribosome hibernation-promoting factor, HPF/YfiA family [Phenylobacterium]|uniref:Ribosomal subunit interface protein n=1 Tax=Phenylobacterium koreense TaxID=266125 RepID=A0ABV2EG51_9CAUL
MQVRVTGKQVDVGAAFRERAADELSACVGKHFERGGRADVVLGREGHAFKVDCEVTLTSGQQLTSHGTGEDAHQALDAAVTRMEQQVRRLTERLKDHHPQALAKQREHAARFVAQPTD